MVEQLGDVLRGGADVAREAGALLLGGHSIEDPEPKYGMVAIGEAHPSEIITLKGARPGDALVLTKAIGTGILSTALKRDMASEGQLESAVRSMRTLNVAAMQAMRTAGRAVHAATDVTGFGLIGHLRNILLASGRGARLRLGSIPLFPAARKLAAQGAVPGGTERNRAASEPHVRWDPRIEEVDRILLNDAQTSGGLLIAIDSSRAGGLVAELERTGSPVTAATIGTITDAQAGVVEVTTV
jgi:selenide,water dikinase